MDEHRRRGDIRTSSLLDRRQARIVVPERLGRALLRRRRRGSFEEWTKSQEKEGVRPQRTPSDERRPAARLQNPANLEQSSDRIGEVHDSPPASYAIERRVRERKIMSIRLFEREVRQTEMASIL